MVQKRDVIVGGIRAIGLVLLARWLIKRRQDTKQNRLRRFHERFGTPDKGVFLVTGASSGVGQALAAELSSQYGYDLIIVARREKELSDFATKMPTKVIVLPTDLQNCYRDEEGILLFRNRIKDALPADKSLAGCLHIAGNSDLAVHGLTDKTPQRNLDMLDLNCRCTLGTLQAVVPLLAQHVSRCGSRALVVTPGALTAFCCSAPTFATSCANKNYVRALTLSLRYEYASDGLDFACACPVAVRSEILDNADASTGEWYMKYIHIPSGAEWAEGVIADLGLGLAETNGRYMDYMTFWMKWGSGGASVRDFFQGRVQSNSLLLNRPIDARPLNQKFQS